MHYKTGYSIFADRFPEVRIPQFAQRRSHPSLTAEEEAAIERDDAARYLASINMRVVDWLPKPGKARHMCVAIT